jgi:hypothetical protein
MSYPGVSCLLPSWGDGSRFCHEFREVNRGKIFFFENGFHDLLSTIKTL